MIHTGGWYLCAMKPWLLLALAACASHDAVAGPDLSRVPKLAVSSPAFATGGEIPMEHTCEGADTAPAITWSGAPATAKSFAIVVDDPDAPDPKAPKTDWTHWVRSGIPAGATSPAGGVDGKNDWGTTGWRGPCPPIGRHRYFFTVYALDAKIGAPGMTKAELEQAIAGHVVAAGKLMGTYQKAK